MQNEIEWSYGTHGRDHLEDLVADRNVIWRRTSRILGSWAWTVFVWLRTGTSGGMLCTR